MRNDPEKKNDPVQQYLYGNLSKLLSKKIQFAWDALNNSKLEEDSQLIAYNYLLFVFDINPLSSSHDKLSQLMRECQENWHFNPYYLPKQRPYYLQVPSNIYQPQRTPAHKQSPVQITQRLFDQGEMIDVNNDCKRYDIPNGIRYFNATQRATYRVTISHVNTDGTCHEHASFYNHQGQLFSTRGMTAHGKPGFAAFTLNANGELSIFNHHFTKDGIAHSSMNAGAPVISAGEVKISNGQLVAINTYSGHYQPSLYNQLRVLDHFNRCGIDISKTEIITHQNLARNLTAVVDTKKIASNQSSNRYSTPAMDLMKPYQEQVRRHMRAFQRQSQRTLATKSHHRLHQLKGMLSENRFFSATYTGNKLKQYKELKAALKEIITQLSENTNMTFEHVLQHIGALEARVNQLSENNNQLREQHRRHTGDGRLQNMIAQLRQTMESAKKCSAIDKIESRQKQLQALF